MRSRSRLFFTLVAVLLAAVPGFAQVWEPTAHPTVNQGTRLTGPNPQPSLATFVGTDLFPFGPSVGDVALPRGDDGYTLVDWTQAGPGGTPLSLPFSNQRFSQAFINMNGCISFGAGVQVFQPSTFPATGFPAMIAPFWADVDTNGAQSGQVWYRTVLNAQELSTIGTRVKNSYLDYPDIGDFTPTFALVVTWDHVGVYPYTATPTLVNTFQAVIVTDGHWSFALFLYPKQSIWWTTGTASAIYPSVGFQSGDGKNYNATGTLTSGVRDLWFLTNTTPSQPGTQVMMISNSEETIPTLVIPGPTYDFTRLYYFRYNVLQFSANAAGHLLRTASVAPLRFNRLQFDSPTDSVTFSGAMNAQATAAGAITSGQVILTDTATLAAQAAGAIAGPVSLMGEARLSNSVAGGTTGSARLTFLSTAGGTGGTFDLNGYDAQVGALQSGADYGLITNSGTSSRVLTINSSTSGNFGGRLEGNLGGTGAFSVVKTGAGHQILSGIGNYSGSTTVAGGILQFAKPSALYNGNGAALVPTKLFVFSGATAAFSVGGIGEFDLTQFMNLVGPGRPYGGFAIGSSVGIDVSNSPGGSFTLPGTLANQNGGNTSVGFTKLGAGKLVLSGTNTYTGGTLISGGTLELGDGGTTGSVIGSITNNATLSFNHSGPISQTGTISGSGAVIKSGTGTLTVANTHSYTGPTTVSAGQFLLQGTAASSAFTVTGSGLLGGGGRTGSLTIANGGTLSPGGSPGRLDGAAGTFGPGGTLQWEINSATGTAGSNPGWDFLVLSGPLTFTATPANKFTIKVTSLTSGGVAGLASGFNPALNYTFRIAQTASIPTFDPAAVAIDTSGFANASTGTWSVGANGSYLNLVYTAPTPTTVTLANLAQTYSGTPRAVAVITAPSGVPVIVTYNGSTTPPTNAGNYAVIATTNDPRYTGSALGTLVVNPAAASITLGGLTATYDGTPKSVTRTTNPGGLITTVTYNGSATAPTDASSYVIGAVVTDANYTGTATGTLTIARAPVTVTLGSLSQTYTGTPRAATANSPTPGVTFAVTYAGSSAPPINVGSYAVVATATGNYTGTASGTLVLAPAPASVSVGPQTVPYDGTGKAAAVITSPPGLSVTATYNGTTSLPIYPGLHAVVATLADPNYTGSSASGTLTIVSTALLRHAPAIAGSVDGSVLLLSPENVALNNTAWISGDLLLPGTPTVTLNGAPTYGGTFDAAGAVAPDTHTVTLGGTSLLRRVVRRIDPIAMPTVSTPPAPAGTRIVTLNAPGQSVGDFATLRNLTLSGTVGTVELPPGTYGNVALSGNAVLVLGIAGATDPAAYNFQNLSLNVLPGTAQIRVVGPVVLTLASGPVLNGPVGASAHPEWLTLRAAAGGLSMGGSNALHGSVVAPSGTVALSGSAAINGTVVADKLTLSGTSTVNDPGL